MKKYVYIKDITVEIIKRKTQKNIYIKISDKGEVRVSSPLFVSDLYIKELILKKYDELKIYLEEKSVKKNKIIENTYITGNKQYIFGKEYFLIVRYNKYQSVVTLGDKIIINVSDVDDNEKKEKLINKFYKELLQEKIKEISIKYEDIMGLKASQYRIKNMKTRWGTCNINKKRIWINLQLVQKDIDCLEYIIVHELTHLVEKNHNKRFYNIVEKYCPNYKQIQRKLNSN
jgi:zinc-dependent protease